MDIGASSAFLGGSSDHATFAESGVPVLMFFGGYFPRTHSTVYDTAEFVRPEFLGEVVIVPGAMLQSPNFTAAVATA